MSDERFLELVPLAALGALDGEERAAFEAALASSPALRRELEAYQELVGRIGADAQPVPPPSAARERLLRATRKAQAPRSAAQRAWLAPVLMGALFLAYVSLHVFQMSRSNARLEAARAAASEARDAARAAQAEAAALREALAREVAFRELVSLPETRVISLAGLAPAPQARARVVWHAGRGEGVLVTTGLAPAPAGRAYALWIIAKAAPVPAGVFQVDADGRAVVRLPAGLQYADVRTFAVTLEPEAGTPAPTGPMMLAGAVS